MPSANRPRSQARKGVQLNRFAPLLLILIGCTAAQPAPAPFVPGVPSDFIQVAAPIQAQYPASFQDASGLTEEQSAANINRNVRMWGPGLDLWPGPQLIGDCTSMGGAHSIQASEWSANGGKPTRRVSTLFLYSLARFDNGKRKIPCNSDGGYPSILAHNVANFGYLYEDEAGLPPYSASAARKAGCSWPNQSQLKLAATRSVSVQPINDVKAWRNALCGGYPPTVAIPWKPGRTYVSDGRVCIRFDGPNLGGHQICSLAYDGSSPSGKKYFFLYNSHGSAWPNGAPKPMQGEPPGGVWVEVPTWGQWAVDNGELWSYSVEGKFAPEPLDLTIFDSIQTEER